MKIPSYLPQNIDFNWLFKDPAYQSASPKLQTRLVNDYITLNTQLRLLTQNHYSFTNPFDSFEDYYITSVIMNAREDLIDNTIEYLGDEISLRWSGNIANLCNYLEFYINDCHTWPHTIHNYFQQTASIIKSQIPVSDRNSAQTIADWTFDDRDIVLNQW